MLNKKIFFIIFYSLIASEILAQKYQFVYYLDENMSTVEKSKAFITGKGYLENDIFNLDCFLNSTGKLFICAQFIDSSINTLNGIFKVYHTNEKLQELGNYKKNEMDGVWKHWDSDGDLTDSSIFKDGVLLRKDSIANNYIEASYPKGEHNLHELVANGIQVHEMIKKNRSSGIYLITLLLEINEKGKVINTKILDNSNCNPCAMEVERLVTHAPNWIPAKKNGKNVKSFKRFTTKYKI